MRKTLKFEQRLLRTQNRDQQSILEFTTGGRCLPCHATLVSKEPTSVPKQLFHSQHVRGYEAAHGPSSTPVDTDTPSPGERCLPREVLPLHLNSRDLNFHRTRQQLVARLPAGADTWRHHGNLDPAWMPRPPRPQPLSGGIETETPWALSARSQPHMCQSMCQSTPSDNSPSTSTTTDEHSPSPHVTGSRYNAFTSDSLNMSASTPLTQTLSTPAGGEGGIRGVPITEGTAATSFLALAPAESDSSSSSASASSVFSMVNMLTSISHTHTPPLFQRKRRVQNGGMY